MAEIILDIDPCPKPRMTRRDRWAKRPIVQRYWAYKDELNILLKDWEPPETLDIIFKIKMPKSWSKKKKAQYDGAPHQKKPDIDNFLKGFMDALYDDDEIVYATCASSYWAYKGQIIINQ